MARRSLLALLLALGAGCSAEQQGHLAPPALAAKSPPVTLPAASAAAVPPAPPLDLESFTPLLALPDLRAAALAVESDDPALAAREVEAALRRAPPAPALVASFQLLLGRLREQASDLPGALASYEMAVAEGWPLTGYARAAAGRMLLRSGRPKEALERLRLVPDEPAVAAVAKLAIADAELLLGRRAAAISAYRDYLALPRSLPDVPTTLRLAEALVDHAATLGGEGRHAALGEALTLSRRALTLAPADADLGARARALEGRALSLLPDAERRLRAVPSPEETLERLRALVEARQWDGAHGVATALLVALGPKGRSSAVGCEAGLLLGRSLGGRKEWGKGADVLADVLARCQDGELRARAFFLAGKYSDADKRFAQAIRHYEALQRELPESRLADDARLRAAQSYRELGAEARFTELLTRLPDDYPAGDMVLDGLFELSTSRMTRGDWSGAAGVLERSAELAAKGDVDRGQEFSGRERYFRARAWGATGDPKKALSEYEAIVRDVPLSYYMLHAYARLASADAERARRALASGLERAAAAPFAFERRREYEDPGFVRALELLRVGDIEAARREIEARGAVRPEAGPALLWGVALLYERAGAARLSHGLARGLLTDWLARWPGGEWTRAWQIAFPRPYPSLVAREAKRNAVPEHLVYAVMREESSFDPEAESPAKAYGLMQLIEPTAREFGRGIGLKGDPASLKRPAVNVAIGCRVLAKLTQSFSENPLLAVPGYNAGPGRPRRWAGERADQDFDLWVELIPYSETRRYTKRVLASRAAYAFLYAPLLAEETMRLPLKVLPR